MRPISNIDVLCGCLYVSDDGYVDVGEILEQHNGTVRNSPSEITFTS